MNRSIATLDVRVPVEIFDKGADEFSRGFLRFVTQAY